MGKKILEEFEVNQISVGKSLVLEQRTNQI